MHFVDDAEVTRVLTFPILIATLEEAHRRPKAEVLGYLGNEKAQYVIRSAADPGRYMASKMFTSFLRRAGWQVDIYERSSVELIGRGVGIFASHLGII
jgi:hypothetical protein